MDRELRQEVIDEVIRRMRLVTADIDAADERGSRLDDEALADRLYYVVCRMSDDELVLRDAERRDIALGKIREHTYRVLPPEGDGPARAWIRVDADIIVKSLPEMLAAAQRNIRDSGWDDATIKTQLLRVERNPTAALLAALDVEWLETMWSADWMKWAPDVDEDDDPPFEARVWWGVDND